MEDEADDLVVTLTLRIKRASGQFKWYTEGISIGDDEPAQRDRSTVWEALRKILAVSMADSRVEKGSVH